MLEFCTPQTYTAAVERVEAALARGAGRARANPLPGLLLRTVAIVLACLPFFTLPYPLTIDLFAPILTLCFALAALWLLPVFGWVVVVGVGWMAVLIAAAASVERRSMFTGELYRVHTLMDGDDWAHLALAGLGAAFLVYLSVGLLRGRIPTALADDEAELNEDPREFDG
jgi:hypothetical protein